MRLFAFDLARAIASFRRQSVTCLVWWHPPVALMPTTDSKANWERIDELNAAFLLTYDEVREFADRIPDLPALMTHRGFAVMIPHNKKSHVLVLARRDPAAVSEVIKQLQPSKPLPQDGAAIVVD